MPSSPHNEAGSFERLHETGITTCPQCGSLRDVLEYKDVPEDADIAIEVEPGEGDFYLHCSECGTYALGGFGGGSFDPPKSSAFASTPSRNSPCLCGSGKKYKRCCGKN
jgi:hypothetical protein